MCRVLAAMSRTVVVTFALIYLRLPFGGAYYLCLWCIVIELICDVANTLLRCDHWDANEVSFNNRYLIPGPKIHKDDISLAQDLLTDVLVDLDPRGKVFCCIDDLIAVELL